MRQRFEKKYIIDPKIAAVLRERASAIMQPDSHSKDGSYVVNNLYLDDRYDNFYYAKYRGAFVRNKFRLRHYNGDLSFIRLERKHKDGLVSYKETEKITEEQYQKVKLGDLEFVLTEDSPLWQKLGVIYRLRGLRPTAMYAYRREAFVYQAGDVRITFDSPLFNPDENSIGAIVPIRYDPLKMFYSQHMHYPMLLEVKYTSFLPETMKRLLNGLPLAHTEMSKYCIARERGILPYGKI
ncbi:MAG: polyphosphate polymerase domain-containing protein [Oscillospiraceae bacterium]|nr:polyphosphate polymerase domain-containing protein [Oscillospiraceae bacterium]MCL2278781.1 polyphosphate polymerase domain-containing protein [Oscillospiraceae bacterium]